MSAAIIPRLLTVGEFEQLPAPPSGHYELHHGEVVLMSPPLHSHKLLQRRLRILLEPLADAYGSVADTEYAYRPLPESEVWVADVVCIDATREQQIEKWLEGSPELVIEVKSAGNTKDALHDKAMTTLAGQGAIEFWVVDPQERMVTVYTKTSGMHLYRDAVPVAMFAGYVELNQLFNQVIA
ncbi:MAG: Uma2 family endonuclease [Bryobacteraceae bacterium]